MNKKLYFGIGSLIVLLVLAIVSIKIFSTSDTIISSNCRAAAYNFLNTESKKAEYRDVHPSAQYTYMKDTGQCYAYLNFNGSDIAIREFITIDTKNEASSTIDAVDATPVDFKNTICQQINQCVTAESFNAVIITVFACTDQTKQVCWNNI